MLWCMNTSNLGFCYALEDAQGPRIAPCANVVDSECLAPKDGDWLAVSVVF